MKEIIVVGLILIVIGIIGEYYLKKKFNINRKSNNIGKLAKRYQRIVLSIIFIIYMVTVFVLLIKYEDINVFFILVPFLIVISLVRMYIQFKYNRHANIWILELFTNSILLLYMITIIYIKL